jgi:hypothetical protein
MTEQLPPGWVEFHSADTKQVFAVQAAAISAVMPRTQGVGAYLCPASNYSGLLMTTESYEDVLWAISMALRKGRAEPETKGEG